MRLLMLTLALAACSPKDPATDDDTDAVVDDTDDPTTADDTDNPTDDTDVPADDTDAPSGVTLDNPSFEVPTIGSVGAWTTEAPTGWLIQAGGQGGSYRGSTNGLVAAEPLAAPADGLQAAYLKGVYGGGYDLLHNRPVFPEDTEPATFTITAVVAKRKDRTLTGEGEAYVAFEPLEQPELCTQTKVDFATLRADEGAWHTVSITCPDIRRGTIRLGAVGFGSDDDELLFDNVRVTRE